MIKRIIGAYVLFACLVAVCLKIGGVDGTIKLGSYFRSFLVQCNIELSKYKFSLPTITMISPIEDNGSRYIDSGSLGIDVLYYWGANLKVLNGIADVINGIAVFFNVIISMFNGVIHVIQLIFIFLKNLINMKDIIISSSTV